MNNLKILAIITETDEEAAPITPTTGLGGLYIGFFPPSHLIVDGSWKIEKMESEYQMRKIWFTVNYILKIIYLLRLKAGASSLLTSWAAIKIVIYIKK